MCYIVAVSIGDVCVCVLPVCIVEGMVCIQARVIEVLLHMQTIGRVMK